MTSTSKPLRGRSVQVWVVSSAAEMRGLRELWNEAAVGQTIFQSFLWSQAAAWHFSGRERPHIVVAKSNSGLAIIPAVLCGREQISLLGETLYDYRDVMAVGDRSVLDYAWAELAKPFRPIEIKAVLGEDRASGLAAFRSVPFATAPAILRSELDGEALAARHRKLGRFSRRILRNGIVLRRHPGTDGELVRTIYELKAAQVNGAGNLFTDPLRREFMQGICALDRGCEVFTYEDGATLVAAIVTFRNEHTRHFYTIYYDPSYGDESPGQVLLFEVAKLSLDEGLDCDFMTGNSAYKARLATRQVPLYKVTATAQELREHTSDLMAKAA